MTTHDAMKKQVDKSHYGFEKYMSKQRWISVWHQLDEVIKLRPESVLEIGPGPGLFKSAGVALGLNIKTLDPDPELSPDYLGSADDLSYPDKAFDVTCAFQVLEHMPFDVSMKALAEMCRVSRKGVVISLPQTGRCWPNTLSFPHTRKFEFILRNPFRKPEPHQFDGEHYWEIDKAGYQLKAVMSAMKATTPQNSNMRTYRVHENPYHRFFVISPLE